MVKENLKCRVTLAASNIFFCTNTTLSLAEKNYTIKSKKLLTVDLLARASMKNAARCDK